MVKEEKSGFLLLLFHLFIYLLLAFNYKIEFSFEIKTGWISLVCATIPVLDPYSPLKKSNH